MANKSVTGRIIFDTGIISRLAKQQPAFEKAAEEIANTRKAYITFATRLELYRWLNLIQHQMGEKKRQLLLSYIEAIPLWPHTVPVTRQALEIGKRMPHIGVADCINAASALVGKCPVFTLNRKHYIAQVKIYQPAGFDFARESS